MLRTRVAWNRARWTTRSGLALAAVLAIAHDSAADPPPFAIDLAYAVHPGCPGPAEFEWKIQSRSPRVAVSTVGDGRAVEVVVVLEGDSSVGTVTIDAERASARRVRAADCSEALDVLAFVIAIAIDPEASDSGSAPPPVETVPATRVEPQPSPPAPEPQAAAPAPTTGSPAPLPAPLGDSGRVEPTDPPSDWELQIGLGAEAAWGIGPDTTAVGRVSTALSLRTRSWLEPVFRLSAARGAERTVETDPGRGGRLTWTTGRAEVCGGAPLFERALRAELCGAGELGSLRGEGFGVQPRRSETRLWSAGLAVARLRLRPVRRFFVEARGHLGLPFRRDDFVVRGPETTVYEVPPWLAGGGVSAGVVWP